MHVDEPAARDQLAQVQVTPVVLHQHDEAAGGLFTALGFEPEVGPDEGFDACTARPAVELDGTEQVAQVGDRECALRVGRRSGHHVVDPQDAIDDGKLGVGAQVNECHRAILGTPGSINCTP